MPDRLAHPTLYETEGDAPLLLGFRCTACGYVGFPRQAYGCERCGAEATSLGPIRIGARGTLVSFARVQNHFGRDIAVPFVMGEIQLAEGPLIRCTLSAKAPADIAIGETMIGLLEANPSAGAEVRELFFKPERV